MKVACYYRVSPTDDPSEDKIEVQKEKIRKYCDKMGWTDGVEFEEPGHVSGTTLIKDRHAAPDLFESIRLGEFSHLVTSDDSRISRTERISEWGIIIDALNDGKCLAANPQAGVEDASTFGGRIMKILKLAFSAKEREDTIARQQGGRERNWGLGHYASGGIPYGIRWIGTVTDAKGNKIPINEWVPVEEEIRIIREAVRPIKGCNSLTCKIRGVDMGAVQKSLRMPQRTFEEIERIARETGRDFSSIAKDLLGEAIKMRRCPGIVFADGVSGRRARIAGTGLEVWEVISTLHYRFSPFLARMLNESPAATADMQSQDDFMYSGTSLASFTPWACPVGAKHRTEVNSCPVE